MRSEQRSTPVRRTCPVCGERAHDLEFKAMVEMCQTCRRALARAETVFWGPTFYVEWMLARARRWTAKWRSPRR